MAETRSKKMTVDEFFEWQQRQDRNYELVDGVPVLHRRPPSGSPADHALLYAKLLRLIRDSGTTFEHDGRRTIKISTSSTMVYVISPWSLDYESFKDISVDVFSSDMTCALIDAEEPRASIWRTVAGKRSSHEICGIDGVVHLVEAKLKFALGALH